MSHKKYRVAIILHTYQSKLKFKQFKQNLFLAILALDSTILAYTRVLLVIRGRWSET